MIPVNASLIADMIKALRYVGCIGGHTCCPETPCHVCGALNQVESLEAVADAEAGEPGD